MSLSYDQRRELFRTLSATFAKFGTAEVMMAIGEAAETTFGANPALIGKQTDAMAMAIHKVSEQITLAEEKAQDGIGTMVDGFDVLYDMEAEREHEERRAAACAPTIPAACATT